MPLGFFCKVLLVAIVLGAYGLKTANAELILYISDGTNSLTIQDGNAVYDTDLETDSIAVDIGQLESSFAGWSFGAFFSVYSNLGNVDGRTAQFLNLEFLATNTSGSPANLEVVASYVGSNGIPRGTTAQMFGGASTDQSSGLGYTFVGTYSQDVADVLYTNGFAPEDGLTRWTFTAAPPFTEDPDNPGSGDLVLDFDNSLPKDIVGDTTYALTYGVRVTNLANGSFFATQSELGYILPEPASIATWAVAVGLAGLAGKRKRNTRTR